MMCDFKVHLYSTFVEISNFMIYRHLHDSRQVIERVKSVMQGKSSIEKDENNNSQQVSNIRFYALKACERTSFYILIKGN